MTLFTQFDKLTAIKEDLKRKTETARYLAGKKKGSWGITTDADRKRQAEISNLTDRIKRLEISLFNQV